MFVTDIFPPEGFESISKLRMLVIIPGDLTIRVCFRSSSTDRISSPRCSSVFTTWQSTRSSCVFCEFHFILLIETRVNHFQNVHGHSIGLATTGTRAHIRKIVVNLLKYQSGGLKIILFAGPKKSSLRY